MSVKEGDVPASARVEKVEENEPEDEKPATKKKVRLYFAITKPKSACSSLCRPLRKPRPKLTRTEAPPRLPRSKKYLLLPL